MIGALREWLLGLIAASVLVAVADGLIPPGGVKRIAGFTGGLILLLALVQPVLRLQPGSLSAGFQGYSAQIEALQEEFQRQGEEELAASIAEKTAAYIDDKATSLGLDSRAAVTTEPNGDGVPCPAAAELACGYDEALSAWLESELGIPRQRQAWKGTQEDG